MMTQAKLTAVGSVPNVQVPGTPEPVPGQNNYGETRIDDPNGRLKQEIMDSQQREFNQMKDTILGQVQATIQGAMAAQRQPEEDEGDLPVKPSNPLLAEYREEMERLGVDEEQLPYLISLFTKVTNKQAGTFKKNLKSEINAEQQNKEKKVRADGLVTEQFPDILNQRSALFTEAQRVYAELQKDKDPILDSPYATAHAVREAASRLGVSAVSRETIRQRDAYNPGGGPGEDRRSDEITQKSLDFGAAFGVHPEKMKEKLQLVHSRKTAR